MAPNTVVKEYDDHKEYNKDARKMEKQGYGVLSVTERTDQRGFLKRRVPFMKDVVYKLVVTYTKTPTKP